jgi:hypothetical protein
MSTELNPDAPNVSFKLPEDRLYIATRAWLLWLQGLFKTRPPGEYRWDPNDDETELIITDQLPNAAERTNKRPIISTSRGHAGFMSTSTSQQMIPSFSSPSTVYSDLIACSVTINVIAREGLEAQKLAYLIFRLIPVFRESILRLGRMHAISNNISLTQESMPGQMIPGSSAPEWRMVQLVVPFFIQDTIRVDEKDFYPLVRAVNLHMGLE